MTTRADYTEEEWATLRRATVVAGFAVSLADPGGPIELTRESMAAMRSAGLPPTDDELLIAVSQDALAQQQRRHNVIGELDLQAATVREQVIEELGRAAAILQEKAAPEEAAAFRQWILQAAQASAEAAMEGGFLGIGATRVSEGEKAMLARVREVLGLPPA
jgi:hypothetical protein